VGQVVAYQIGDLAGVVLPVGVQRHHHVGAGIQRAAEAVQQGHREVGRGGGVDGGGQAQAGRQRQGGRRVGGRADEVGGDLDAARRKGAASLVQFGEHRFGGSEAVLRGEEYPDQHVGTLSCPPDRETGPVRPVREGAPW